MSLIYNVPLIRQESFTNCWFASGRMVRSYGMKDANAKNALVDEACSMQRAESKTIGRITGDKSWLYAKLLQGNLFALGTSRAIEASARNNYSLVSSGLVEPGLNFYFGADLDRYLTVEKLERVNTGKFLDVVMGDLGSTNRDIKALRETFYLLEAELMARGPLMTSIQIAGGTSHAVTVVGVLRTATGQSFPAYNYPTVKGEVASEPSKGGFWVVLQDPTGSMFSVSELQGNDKVTRGSISAEQYKMPLNSFLTAMRFDYEIAVRATEVGEDHAGQTARHPSLVYDPDFAAGKKHKNDTATLPDEVSDYGLKWYVA